MTRPDQDDELLVRARALRERTAGSVSSNQPARHGRLRRVGQRLGGALAWATFRREDGRFVRDANGRRRLAPARLGLVVLGLIATMVLLHVLFRALYYYGTAFSETVYVTGKQEIETGEVYQFGGCTSLPCSTRSDNGKFYLIEASLYFPLLIYPEEDVFANIPQQGGACEVRGYGFYIRELRWLYKQAQLYQHVVDVSCRPYTADEIERAVGSGTIIDDQGQARDGG